MLEWPDTHADSRGGICQDTQSNNNYNNYTDIDMLSDTGSHYIHNCVHKHQSTIYTLHDYACIILTQS